MNPTAASEARRRVHRALLVGLALAGPPACGSRYVYAVPVGELARHPLTGTAVSLRTSDGDVVRTAVERVSFDDGRYGDLRLPGVGARVTQAARSSTGNAYLTVARRSFAARNGAIGASAVVGILGAFVGGLAGVGLCVDGCASVPAAATIGALLGAGVGAAIGASLGGLLGAAIDAQRTAEQPATLLDAGP